MADGNGWGADKRFVEGQLDELREQVREMRIEQMRQRDSLADILAEIRGYKTAARALMAFSAGIGALIGFAIRWIKGI